MKKDTVSNVEKLLISFFALFFIIVVAASYFVKENKRKTQIKNANIQRFISQEHTPTFFAGIDQNTEVIRALSEIKKTNGNSPKITEMAEKKEKKKKTRFGFVVFATGAYRVFIDKLLETARLHLFKGFEETHEFTFFVFSDSKNISLGPNAVFIYQKRVGWPFDSMFRQKFSLDNFHILKGMDYLFFTDADLYFIRDISPSELAAPLVGCLHPGFDGKRGSFENRPDSTAYVGENEGNGDYFAGGFWGGTRKNVKNALKTIANNVQIDMDHGIVAVWHEESHLNRFFLNHPPILKLNHKTLWPEGDRGGVTHQTMVIHLEKDHAALRTWDKE